MAARFAQAKPMGLCASPIGLPSANALPPVEALPSMERKRHYECRVSHAFIGSLTFPARNNRLLFGSPAGMLTGRKNTVLSQRKDAMKTIILLTISNIFMTFAWYGHLKFKSKSLWIVIIASWAIAFFEYCFQVPANRIGHGQFTAAQLKTIQEIITLTVFAAFSIFYLREEFRWNYLVGFIFILLSVFFVFYEWK
ncbi:MAG: DMT family protein [Planctomycetales bacterium]|nr:DMT family protein [Planctomycetales bacterium]